MRAIYHVVSTTDATDFHVVGQVSAITDADAFKEGVKQGLINQRGNYLVVQDETGRALPKRTYKITSTGRLLWLEGY
jgi:hypothetical protein